MQHIDFQVVQQPINWKCAKCGHLIRQAPAGIVVVIDDKQHILRTTETATCGSCGDKKEGTTPMLFESVEAAWKHGQFLKAKFEEGDPHFSILVADCGVVSPSTSTVQ